MKCRESPAQDVGRKCTAVPRRKARRSSNISSPQKPLPPRQKSQILKSPVMSPSQQFQSILGSLRLTCNEHDLLTMLLTPQQEPKGWSKEEDEEGIDKETWHKFKNNKDWDTSSSSGIEQFNAEENHSRSAVGILQEIVDIEKAWISWSS